MPLASARRTVQTRAVSQPKSIFYWVWWKWRGSRELDNGEVGVVPHVCSRTFFWHVVTQNAAVATGEFLHSSACSLVARRRAGETPSAA
jgi:hypothetical protein